MSELGKFIAFKATVKLINDDGNNDLLQDVYQDCIAQADLPASEMENHVKRLYDRYTDEQISAKIAELVYPKNVHWEGELEIVFLPVEKCAQRFLCTMVIGILRVTIRRPAASPQ